MKIKLCGITRSSRRKHQIQYFKPNMTCLKGKHGRAILAEIRQLPIASIDDIHMASQAYIKKAMAERKDV